jgi:hypothetical protein
MDAIKEEIEKKKKILGKVALNQKNGNLKFFKRSALEESVQHASISKRPKVVAAQDQPAPADGLSRGDDIKGILYTINYDLNQLILFMFYIIYIYIYIYIT